MKPLKGIHPQTGVEKDILQSGTITMDFIQAGGIRPEITVKDFMNAPYSVNQVKDQIDAPRSDRQVKDQMDAHR